MSIHVHDDQNRWLNVLYKPRAWKPPNFHTQACYYDSERILEISREIQQHFWHDPEIEPETSWSAVAYTNHYTNKVFISFL